MTYSDAWLEHLDTENTTGNNKVYSELVSTCKNIFDAHNIFELGCGPGTFLDTCKGSRIHCTNYFGIDADRTLISIAKEKHGNKFLTLNLCHEKEKLKEVLQDNAFDTLLCIRLLNYLDDDCLNEVLIRLASSSITNHVFIIPMENISNTSETEILQYEFNGCSTTQYARTKIMYLRLIENTLQTQCEVRELHLNSSKQPSHLLVISKCVK